MSHFSDFRSNFNSSILPAVDILSTVSNSIGPLTTTLNGGGSYYGRYFVLGNLLIQFSDFSQGISPGSSTQNSFTMNYPIPYEFTPYCVYLQPIKQENQNFPCNLTLISFNIVQFEFHISTNNGEVGFLVIGPRPSSL